MNPFDQWILEKSVTLGLAIKEYTWPKQFGGALYDFSATISIEDHVYQGRGIAKTKDLAIRKAVIESLERFFALKTGGTTNGVAAHTDSGSARESALNELLERDLFLSHFYSKKSLFVASEYMKYISADFLEYINRNNDEIRFLRSRISNLGFALVCLISGRKRWGGVLGLSFYGEGLSIAEAIEKCFAEAFREYFHLYQENESTKNLALSEFNGKKNWEFSDHALLLRNLDYFEGIRYLFSGVCEVSGKEYEYRIDDFRFESLFHGEFDLASTGFSVVRTSGNGLFNLYPGPNDNVDVLNVLKSKEMLSECSSQVSWLPHPIS